MNFMSKRFFLSYFLYALFYCNWIYADVDLKTRCNDIETKLTKLPNIYDTKNPEVLEALQFLDKMQNPEKCTNISYVMVMDIPPHAGFAAQFQLVAKEWLRGAAGSNFSVPVLFEWGLRLYTKTEECKEYNYKLDCLFLPLSKCEKELIATGTRIPYSFIATLNGNDASMPPQFRHLGFPLWWGIIQARIFRLQPKLEAHVLQKARLMGNCTGFPFQTSTAGLHVRHGDKGSDGFREHSYVQELSAIHASPDCAVRQGGNCFTSNTSICKDTEVNIFVASDDATVLRDATMNGHLIVPVDIGLSQSTGSVGMVGTLIHHPTLGYNASLEVISDIYFLSHCSTLVGMAASQVFRMSVAISNATGLLKYAAAVDFDQINHVLGLSRKYDVVFAENFQVAKYGR